MNANKLLMSKWTAVRPAKREKHFIVIRLLEPEQPGYPFDFVEIEAVYTRRTFIMPWRDLQDEQHWRQGWA